MAPVCVLPRGRTGSRCRRQSGQLITMPSRQAVVLSAPQSPCSPSPACRRQDLHPQHSVGVTLGSGGPVGPRLSIHASLSACRDARAGRSGGEDQGLRQGMGALGLEERREKALKGGSGSHRMWARGPPTCTPPPLSPWGRQEAAHPRVPGWGRGTGSGNEWGEG